MKQAAILMTIWMLSGCTSFLGAEPSNINQLSASEHSADQRCSDWPGGYCYYTKTPPR